MIVAAAAAAAANNKLATLAVNELVRWMDGWMELSKY